jgi:hypothetical protein
MTDHAAVRAARKAVASRLADALIQACANLDAEASPILTMNGRSLTRDIMAGDLTWLTEQSWLNAVKYAKAIDPTWKPSRYYSPSEETRRLTATIIRYRLQADSEQDPFAGLGTGF